MSHSTLDDGSLVLHNSRTGGLGVVSSENAQVARAALRRSARHREPLEGILGDLQEGGFLVPEGTDEALLVQRQYVSKYTDAYLNLIILPTEQCNFRCPYCYESFERGEMSAEIEEGIRRYVLQQPRMRRLEISWFGGEPLLAPEVVTSLSAFFASHCRERGIEYTAAITTNGSLLTDDVVEKIIPYGVRRFQVTLDGLRHQHDKRRLRLGGGRGTFDDIMGNLRYLRRTQHDFTVILRHNFDPGTVEEIPDFIAMLKSEFGGDARFLTTFTPVGRWGGPNDANLSVCESRASMHAAIRAKELAIEAGIRGGVQVAQLQPNGYVCYAANPRSFVIGPDGSVYKCTVELDYHDRNIVGRLHPDGTMTLDWRKMALWCETNGLDEGKKCVSCFFSPACHGAICPKQWMDENDCVCPTERIGIRQILPLLAKEARLPQPPNGWSVAACTRE